MIGKDQKYSQVENQKKLKDEDIQKILSSKEDILVVFGTTDKGIHEMLDKKIK